MAISLRGGGLLTPAIHDAAGLPLAELMSRLRDLVTRARAGRLRGSELTDATITVTNLGDQGVESVFGVIYPPQVALVGFGKITERPVAVDGLIGVRPVVVTTLAADHRASDGYTGARYLTAISDLLQQPEDLYDTGPGTTRHRGGTRPGRPGRGPGRPRPRRGPARRARNSTRWTSSASSRS